MNRTITLCSALLALLLSAALAQGINWTEHPIDPALTEATWAEACDLDGDGHQDVLGAGGPAICWYHNNGYQIFTEHTVSSNFAGAYCVRGVDLDQDDDMDILGAAITGNQVAWWENDGNTNFTFHAIAAAAGANKVEAVDLDEDGDLDILVACGCSSTKKISWFENTGGMNFVEHLIVAANYYGWWVESGDVDADGDSDVIAVDYQSGSPLTSKVSWFENDGIQNFTRHDIVVQAGAGFYCARGCDLNGDGDMDILVSSYGSDFIRWYQNDGNQNFTPHDIVLALDGPEHMDMGDIDDDGDQDFAVAAWMDYHYYWFENDGTGANFTQHLIGYMYCGGHVDLVDMDEDTDLDMVGTAYYGHKVTWWESDQAGVFPLTMTITPSVTPVQIPAGGGSFDFTFNMQNSGTTPYIVDVWTDITLPTGPIYPILNRENITISPGGSLIRNLTQFVPGTAMSGVYSYNAYVRDHSSWQVYLQDSFPFEKLSGLDLANSDWGWALLGWDDPTRTIPLVPDRMALSAYPNPFNPATVLTYSLPEAGRVRLTIYDVSGKSVAKLMDGWREAGIHQVTFDGSNLTSGIYLYSLTDGRFTSRGKLALLK